MKRFDDYPKSIRKALRYIHQDASLVLINQLETSLTKVDQEKKLYKRRKRNYESHLKILLFSEFKSE